MTVVTGKSPRELQVASRKERLGRAGVALPLLLWGGKEGINILLDYIGFVSSFFVSAYEALPNICEIFQTKISFN
jgi:hypothetical protein